MGGAEAMWAADQASRRLGMELEELAAGRARIRMSVAEWMANGHDICHGGIVFTLADSAFALACNSGDDAAVAAACDVVFVAPARVGDVLVAQANERTRFDRSGVYDVTVRRAADDAVIAEFRGYSRVIGG